MSYSYALRHRDGSLYGCTRSEQLFSLGDSNALRDPNEQLLEERCVNAVKMAAARGLLQELFRGELSLEDVIGSTIELTDLADKRARGVPTDNDRAQWLDQSGGLLEARPLVERERLLSLGG